MNQNLPRPPGFWTTVGLLLRAARNRAAGRRKRQRELIELRAGRSSTDWGGLAAVIAVFVMAVLNVLAAFVVRTAVISGQRAETERQGKIVVSPYFFDLVRVSTTDPLQKGADTFPAFQYSSEARNIADRYGGSPDAIEQKLRTAVREHGTEDFVTSDVAAPGLTALASFGPFTAMLGSMVLIWWGVMLVFQGEGLDLDTQRRRHPMWEWLFSHPVPSGAIFLAEMLAPIAANPIYWSAPLFVGVMYGFVYGGGLGFWAAVLIGIPVTIAAACLGKALEIAVTLRFPLRSRGAVIGLMGWMGYASTMLFFLGMFFLPKVISATAGFLDFFTVLPWPWLRLFLGGQSDGSFSFLAGLLTCWVAAGITLGAAVSFSIWGAQRGLSGNPGQADFRPSRRKQGTRFGREPLYRKEFLWFVRDRSAIVQSILIPVTVAAFQLFNFRDILSHAQSAWNYLCGAAILFGTYFLWILGPKSLISEGTALWIALTWPRGLESLLKAKAWLWSLISTAMVGLVLCYAAFLFPGSIWQIGLVGIGWFLFSRSMAEKSVTLVTVTSSSGEREKVPRGRQWAAQLGMLTFSIGVLTQQWHLAVIGIVYSFITAAAMWQNFRARLPYLYDPWSETLPPPPTLMHAMIAISILVEGGAVLTGFIFIFTGAENIAIAQAISYGICAVLVSIGTAIFLKNRGVEAKDVWNWRAETAPASNPASGSGAIVTTRAGIVGLLLLGAAGGLTLGLVAQGYVALLHHIPSIAEILRKSEEAMAKISGLRISYAVMAVAFAPFAEEYLFRGLLFRGLDREWGGWRAIVGSAAFFAIYHQPLAWPPVFMLGMVNAFLFKKTGRLEPAVILHLVYNAFVSVYT